MFLCLNEKMGIHSYLDDERAGPQKTSSCSKIHLALLSIRETDNLKTTFSSIPYI